MGVNCEQQRYFVSTTKSNNYYTPRLPLPSLERSTKFLYGEFQNESSVPLVFESSFDEVLSVTSSSTTTAASAVPFFCPSGLSPVPPLDPLSLPVLLTLGAGTAAEVLGAASPASTPAATTASLAVSPTLSGAAGVCFDENQQHRQTVTTSSVWESEI